MEAQLEVALRLRELDIGCDYEFLGDAIERPDVAQVDCSFGAARVLRILGLFRWRLEVYVDADWRKRRDSAELVVGRAVALGIGAYLNDFAGGCGEVCKGEVLSNVAPLSNKADADIRRDLGR